MKNMMTINEKIELAVWMCENNPHIALTGSLMLYIRERANKDNFILNREPEDIDFIVDANDEDTLNFVLPPFIEKLDTEFSEFLGYEVLARFWYNGTKVEFIESPTFRYTSDYIPSKIYGKERDFLSEFLEFKRGHGNIRLALVSDLIVAKKEYIEKDSYIDYLSKTRKDLEIIEEKYKSNIESVKTEYFNILKSYIERSWYYKTLKDDKARKYVEDIIYDYEVRDNNTNKEWFEYIKNIDRSWLDRYNEFKKSKDPWWQNHYYVGYDEEKMLDSIIYEHKILF